MLWQARCTKGPIVSDVEAAGSLTTHTLEEGREGEKGKGGGGVQGERGSDDHIHSNTNVYQNTLAHTSTCQDDIRTRLFKPQCKWVW